MSQYLDGRRLSRVRLGDLVRTRPGNSKLIKGKLPAAPCEGLFAAYSASGQDVFAPQYEYDGNAVVISAVGARCGKCFLAAGKWTGIANTHALLPDETRITAKFLWYQVNDERFWVRGGSAQPFVRVKDSLEKLIYAPDLAAQHNIVAEIEKQFSRLDEAVANLQRVKANLKRYKGAVLQSVTSGQLETDGQASRECGEPQGWRRLTIEELASREPRSVQSGPFGSNLLHSEFQASGKLVIGIDNVQDGAYSIGANHRISESKFADLEKYRARPQDVLITVMATVGRVCVLPEGIEPAIITKHVYRITVDRAVALPEYVGIALRGARDVRAQLLGSVQGQTRPGLNGTLIKRIRVPIPPLAEQHRIVAEVDRRLSIVREVEAEVDANLKRAQALRQSTLSAAFAMRGPRETMKAL